MAGVDTSTCPSSDHPVNVGLADGRLSFISFFFYDVRCSKFSILAVSIMILTVALKLLKVFGWVQRLKNSGVWKLHGPVLRLTWLAQDFWMQDLRFRDEGHNIRVYIYRLGCIGVI